jgi:O-Antigen ligase
VKSEVTRFSTSDFLIWIMVGVTLFFYTPAMDVFNFPKQWLLICLTLGLVSHYILSGRKYRHSKDRFSNTTIFLISVLAVTMTLSAMFSDTTFVRSIFGFPGRANGLMTYFCILAMVWVGSRTKLSTNFTEKIPKIVIAIYLIFGSYATLQVLNLDPVAWNNPYNRVIGTLGNPNFAGAFLGVGAAVFLNSFFRSNNKFKFGYLIFATWLLILALATQSIQALGIFMVGALLILSIFAFRKFKYQYFMSFVSLVLAGGMVVFLGLLGFGPLGEYLFQYTLRLRIEYWRIGLEIARHYPFTGIGPDSYVEGFRLYRGTNFVSKYSQSVSADSAHNVLINFLANFGIPAFVIFSILIGIISWKATKILFAKDMIPIGTQMLAMIWLLMLVQSFFSLEQIGLNVFQWVCGAILLNQGILNWVVSERKDEHYLQSKKTSFFEGLRSEFSILVIITAMIFGWTFMRQEMSLLKVASIPIGAKLSESELQSQTSVFNFFVKDEIRRSIFLSNFYLNSERYSESEKLMTVVLSKDGDAVEAMEQLARLARFRGDLAGEISFRKRIELIDPYNYGNLLSLAQTFLDLSNFNEAQSYAKKVLSMSLEEAIKESATAILKTSS